MNIKNYKLQLDIKSCSDDMLEIMFGKAGLRLLRIIQDCEPIFSHDYNCMEYKINDEVLMYYHIENEIIWVNYYNIWSILESEFNFNYTQITNLITSILVQILKYKIDVTAYYYNYFPKQLFQILK